MTADQKSKNLFISALESGDFDNALRLMDDPLSKVNLPNMRTPLHYACQYGRTDVAEQLITNFHYSIDSPDVKDCTPLHLAAQYGHLQVVQYLVEDKKCDPMCPDMTKVTPLHLAALHGKLDVVKYFTETRNCDPQVKTTRNNTPIYFSARGGYLKVVKFLVEEMKCDPNDKNHSGHAPLHAASENGHLDVTKYLVNTCHCNPQETTVDGSTALHYAAFADHMEIVKFLTFEKACDANHRNNSGLTPLHTASENGCLEIVQYLVNSCDGNPEVSTAELNTPLHFAAHQGHLEVVKFLIDVMKCNPLPVNYSGHVPLHDASEGGHLDVVKYIVNTCNGDPGVTTPDLNTPLHFAARGGHLDVVKFFVDTMECNPLCMNKSGHVPLHDASDSGHLDVVRYFVDSCRCEPQVKTTENNTPLHCAARNGNLAVVNYFIEDVECSPNCTNRSGQLPLHVASENGHIDVVKYLVEKCHCDPLAKTNKKNTPLHSAARGGQLKVVKFFIEDLECDPNCRNSSAHVPLHVASESGHLQVVKYLVSMRQCDPQVRTRKNSTPLHRAARGGHLDVVEYLVKVCKCDPQVKTVMNSTPLHSAARGGHLEVVKFLIDDINCDVNCSNNSGQVPLHVASEHGHLDTVKYLVHVCHCDPHVKTASNATPLQCAENSGHQTVVNFFGGITTPEEASAGQESFIPNGSECGEEVARDDVSDENILQEQSNESKASSPGAAPDEEFPQELTSQQSDEDGDAEKSNEDIYGDAELQILHELVTPGEAVPPSDSSTSESEEELITEEEVELEDMSVPLLQEEPSLPGVLLSEPVTQETVTSDGKEIDLEENAGISVSIPKNSVPEDQPVDLTIVTSFSGPFRVPDDVISASPAYLIKSSNDVELIQDADVKLHHNANLQSQEDCDDMVFMESSSTPKYSGPNNTGPVYEFQRVEGKRVEFSHEKKNLGVVKQKHFNSWLKIGRKRKDGEESGGQKVYSARLYRAVKEDRIRAVFCMCPWHPQYGTFCDKVITKGYSGMTKKAEGRTFINNLAIVSDEVELVKSEPTTWKITMDISPAIISKMEIDIPDETNTEISQLDDYPPRIVVELIPPMNNSAPAVLKLVGLDSERSFQIADETIPGLSQLHTQLIEVEAHVGEIVNVMVKVEELLQDSTSLDALLEKVQGISDVAEGVDKFAKGIKNVKDNVSEVIEVSHELNKLLENKLHNSSGRTGCKPEPLASIMRQAEKLDQTRAPPKLRNIWFVHNEEGERYELMEKIAVTWHKIGSLLGIDHGVLKSIEEEKRKNQDRIREVLERWFENADGLPNHGKYPLSWKGLYTLLVHARLSNYAKEFFKVMEHVKN